MNDSPPPPSHKSKPQVKLPESKHKAELHPFTMAAITNPMGILDSLFRPSTRFQLRGGRRFSLPRNFTEVELLPNLTAEDVVATGINWDDFRCFVHDKFVWMAPGIYISSAYRAAGLYPVAVEVGAMDDSAGMRVRVKPGTAPQTATATCNFLVRLLATSDQCDVYLQGSSRALSPICGPALSHFFEHGGENLRAVTLRDMIFNEEHIRVLASAPQHKLQLALRDCKFSDGDASKNALLQWLQSGRGPTELYRCAIDSAVVAGALKGNSRLDRLLLCQEKASTAGPLELASIFRGLAEDRGLTEFDAFWYSIGDANWTLLCQSLQMHPTLTSLGLACTGPKRPTDKTELSEVQKTNRTRALADMMLTNTNLHTIRLFLGEYDERIYTESIEPRLEANLYRPRVLAVKKEADDRPFRKKVLGRALNCVKSNPNLLWMFLSENVDAFVRSDEQVGNNKSEVAVAVPAAACGSKRKRC
jgi:hypothetical protein